MLRALSILVLGLSSCTVVPPHGFPPLEEREVRAVHAVPRHGSVRVPQSHPELTILWLRTEPAEVCESFRGKTRRLHVEGGRLTVHCRYRVYADDTTELPRPEALFPDAISVETLWRRQM